MADEIRPIVLFIVESGLAKLRKRVFGPRSLVFGVRGPLRFESGLGFSLPIPLCLIWSGGEELLRWPSLAQWLLALWLWSLSVEIWGGARPLLSEQGWEGLGTLRHIIGPVHHCGRISGEAVKTRLPRPVLTQLMWGGFRSFLEIVRGVTVEHRMISRGAARLHLRSLGWRGSALGRLSSECGRKGLAGGNAFPWQGCTLTAVSVLPGLSLSTSSILMWSGRPNMHFGLQRARKCSTGRI